ncbi:DUF6168 family protein [Tenacibaculum jejuense]|uniref:Putative membrane protein n=1 Tax=Tenacibaculum jejuense TaxID=584609 RepID=A0A238U6H9_9FLAO|nr:DUF6168 family protein [Tenacibaculum jejuense]SNR13990.1 putative membrane protein [Tenacibaculum jejuense]
MIKRILLFTAVLVFLFILSYFTNTYLVKEMTISFSLLNVYVFHVLAALVVYAIVEFIADILPNQAGYAYLASIFIKIGLFVLIFNASVFSKENLSRPERVSLVVPLFLFLITEAVAISKLLNNKQFN